MEVVFDDGSKRLVLRAWETFKVSGSSFENDVKDSFENWSRYEKTEFTLKKLGENTIIGIPKTYNTEDDAVLYLAIFFNITTICCTLVFFHSHEANCDGPGNMINDS